MAEISADELAEYEQLKAIRDAQAAAGLEAAAPVTITAAELAEYQQLKAIRKAQQGDGPRVPAPPVPSRALLADGTTHDYVGAHPSHVDNGAGPVPVIAWHNV